MENKDTFTKFILFSIIGSSIIAVLIITLVFFKGREKEILNAKDAPRYMAKIDLNGATEASGRNISCTKEKEGCFITLPTATRKDGEVLGFSLNKDDKLPMYSTGEVVSIDHDTTFYVISYETFLLHIADVETDYLEENNLTCNAYNHEESCSVKIPLFNKEGYENRGYSTSEMSLTGFIFPNDEYTLSRDVKLYPIYGTISRSRSIKVDKTITLGKTIIEVEKGCREEDVNTLLSYIEEIEDIAPFLLVGGKISFLTDKTFDEIWGTNFVGMNFGPRSLRSLDVRCSNRAYNNYYATIVHELTHSWDFYYATKLDKNISSESDIINLFNKYLNDFQRPFRSYSYSNIYEFLADAMRYYYFKYYVPTTGFSNLDYPSDIKKTLEKYVCIASNNYNKDKCK